MQSNIIIISNAAKCNYNPKVKKSIVSRRASINKKIESGTKKICTGMKEYFQLSTIHGLRYIIEPNRSRFERIFWAILVFTVAVLSIWIVVSLYFDFLDAPTATTQMPTRKSVTNVPFPSIGICDGNRISNVATRMFAKKLFNHQNKTNDDFERTIDDIYQSLIFLGSLYKIKSVDFNFNDLDHLHAFLSDYYNGSYSLGQVMDTLHDSCFTGIHSCKWQGQDVDCRKIFTERKTHIGLCCLFNYQRLKPEKLQAIYESGSTVPDSRPIRLHGPGVEMGLSVVIEHRNDDYSYFLNSNLATYVYVFEPLDFPDQKSGAIAERIINAGQELFLSLHPKPVVGIETMRDIPYYARGCLFNDEQLGSYHGFYSFSECYLLCQIEDLLRFCNCYPFYLPVQKNSAECVLPDMLCLQKWITKWNNVEADAATTGQKQPVSYQCQHCLPTCSYINYKIQSSYAYIKAKINSTNKIRLNLTETSSVLHVYFGEAFVVEFQQTIVHTWDELLSMFGGLFSIMLGASILSGAEYIYYQTGKCFTILFQKQKSDEIDEEQIKNLAIKKYNMELEKAYKKIKRNYWHEIQLEKLNRIPKFQNKIIIV